VIERTGCRCCVLQVGSVLGLAGLHDTEVVADGIVRELLSQTRSSQHELTQDEFVDAVRGVSSPAWH
jgi:hypothetical protein